MMVSAFSSPRHRESSTEHCNFCNIRHEFVTFHSHLHHIATQKRRTELMQSAGWQGSLRPVFSRGLPPIFSRLSRFSFHTTPAWRERSAPAGGIAPEEVVGRQSDHDEGGLRPFFRDLVDFASMQRPRGANAVRMTEGLPPRKSSDDSPTMTRGRTRLRLRREQHYSVTSNAVEKICLPSK